MVVFGIVIIRTDIAGVVVVSKSETSALVVDRRRTFIVIQTFHRSARNRILRLLLRGRSRGMSAGRRQLRSRFTPSSHRLSASTTRLRIRASRQLFGLRNPGRRAASATTASATVSAAKAESAADGSGGRSGDLLAASSSLGIRHSRPYDLRGGEISDGVAGDDGKAVDGRGRPIRPRRHQRLGRQKSERAII